MRVLLIQILENPFPEDHKDQKIQKKVLVLIKVQWQEKITENC